jgi:ATP-dependent Lon protease
MHASFGMATTPLELPVVPTREQIVFPTTIVPITVHPISAVRALMSLGPDPMLALIPLEHPSVDEPSLADLHPIGVMARVIRVAKADDGGHAMAVVQGMQRVRVLEQLSKDPFLKVRVALVDDVVPGEPDPLVDALRENVRDLASAIVAASPTLPNELIPMIQELGLPGALADFATRVLPSMTHEARLALLDQTDVRTRLSKVFEELVRERERLSLRQRITAEVEKKIDHTQRQLILREQLGAIRRELGEGDSQEKVLETLREKIASSGLNDAARQEALRELERFSHLPPESAESSVIRTYLDWMTALPWTVTTAQRTDVEHAQKALDEDHWDLTKVKERIVEYLAVTELRKDLRGPLLCFLGPPGVGKTSIGKSIARASGRAFLRLSLGGMHDEAEIRGHRRTYVGALPGAIIQGLRRAGTRDAVFMLDEIDKLGKDFRGDPAAALMEVLDPEQNAQFRDHYLDVPFDLSQLLFITTANYVENIPKALLDRMEVLELPGYGEEDKLEIARRFLVPKQLAENGLSRDEHLVFGDEGLRRIVRDYTREAGVRGLERAIASVCRKRARALVSGDEARWEATPQLVRARLGVPTYEPEIDVASRVRRPGVAVALAWTSVGGDVLFVETARMPRDKGDVIITGHLGDVMQESVLAALSWAKANGARYGVPADAFRQSDVHVHVPSGAVPKDGPSAGVVMAIALISLFTGRKVRPCLAATGEIGLTGEVLPVGGLHEKLLAARRAGVREVLLPRRNEANVLEDVPEHVRAGITLAFVSSIDEALEHALEPVERPLAARAEVPAYTLP